MLQAKLSESAARLAVEHRIRVFGWLLVALGGLGCVVLWVGGESLVRSWLGSDLAGAPSMLKLHASLDPAVRDLDYFLGIVLPAGARFYALTGLVGLVLARSQWSRAFAELFYRAADARDLALLRVVVFLSVAAYTRPSEIGRFADLPAELLVAPVGWGWLLHSVTLSPGWAVPLAWLLIGTALAAAVGFRPKLTAWLTVVLGIFVLGIPQFFGKINHFHHLIWFAAVLAVSPAWDVWSLSGRKEAGAAVRGIQYGRPLIWIWLLIGGIYFFPGFWKVAVDGAAWIDGSALAAMLHAQWFRMDAVPAVRVDVGVLGALAGTAVLLFEVGFIFALVKARTRTVFVGGAVLFHLGVLLVAGINFWSLAVCLVAFAPVGALMDRLRPDTGEASASVDTQPSTSPVDRLGGAFIGLMLVAGFTGLDTWPVALYPTFAGIPDHRYATLMLDTSDGLRIDPYQSEGLRSAFGQSRIMGLAWQLGRAGDGAQDRAKAVLAAFAPYERRLVPGDSVAVLMVHLDIRPEHRREIRSIPLGRFRVPEPQEGASPATRRFE